MPLDEFLPEYEFSERHSAGVAAPAERVLAAARGLDARELRLTRVLMSIRSRSRAGPSGEPVLDRMLERGFVLLAERPDEVVLGAVGRFWRLDSGFRAVDAGEFAAFSEPGYAKAAMNFRVEAAPGDSLLSTETRIHVTDEAARRSFRRYWRVVHPGSALIRREWLRAIRLRAERDQSSASASSSRSTSSSVV